MPPPHWAVMYMAARMGDMARMAQDANVTAGFIWAPVTCKE